MKVIHAATGRSGYIIFRTSPLTVVVIFISSTIPASQSARQPSLFSNPVGTPRLEERGTAPELEIPQASGLVLPT